MLAGNCGCFQERQSYVQRATRQGVLFGACGSLSSCAGYTKNFHKFDFDETAEETTSLASKRITLSLWVLPSTYRADIQCTVAVAGSSFLTTLFNSSAPMLSQDMSNSGGGESVSAWRFPATYEVAATRTAVATITTELPKPHLKLLMKCRVAHPRQLSLQDAYTKKLCVRVAGPYLLRLFLPLPVAVLSWSDLTLYVRTPRD